MRKSFATLGLALLAAPLLAQSAEAPFIVQESGAGYSSLADAVDSIGDGQGTILIAPGRYRMCAVQEDGSIAYVAQQPGTVTFDGAICEGKAALVLKGREARIEGLVFQNLRVPDGNGAGIRLQEGDLTVRETLFRNSESGILSHDDPSSSILIERSTFSGLGRCDRDIDCAHSIYIGEYGSLRVVQSRFEKGKGGHYVKSRAPVIEVIDSSFDDTGGKSTNYMIDISNGATGRIAGNAFVQGSDKENYSALIMVAGEGADHSSDGLVIAGNEASVAPAFDHDTTFVVDRSGDSINMGENRLGEQIARFAER